MSRAPVSTVLDAQSGGPSRASLGSRTPVSRTSATMLARVPSSPRIGMMCTPGESRSTRNVDMPAGLLAKTMKTPAS